jgi:hypothetical protein
MVVVAAAALGAAGYGLYKGGEAGVEKGKECHREMQREKKRSSKVASLREKNKTRSSRIAEIVQMKKNGGTPPSATTSTSAAPAFTFSSTNTSTTTSTSSTTNNNTTRASFAERQLAEKEANSGVDDRHRSVMQKLRSSRQDERKKGSSNNKLRSLNPFKKK